MTFETTRSILAWCSLINLGLLTWWFLFFVFARNWMLKIHGRWFRIPEERFDSIHYSGMAFYKICILIFNLVPYLAMRIIVSP